MRIKRYDRGHIVELSDGKATYVVLHANHSGRQHVILSWSYSCIPTARKTQWCFQPSLELPASCPGGFGGIEAAKSLASIKIAISGRLRSSRVKFGTGFVVE